MLQAMMNATVSVSCEKKAKKNEIVVSILVFLPLGFTATSVLSTAGAARLTSPAPG